MDIGQSILLGQLGSFFSGLIKNFAMKDDPGAIVLGVVYLYQRGGSGHYDGGGHSRCLGGIGQPLRVVSSRGSNESPGFFFFTEGANFIVGSTDFVGTGDLHIFRLEIDLISARLGQGGGVDQAGGADHALQSCAGGFELFQGEHDDSSFPFSSILFHGWAVRAVQQSRPEGQSLICEIIPHHSMESQ